MDSIFEEESNANIERTSVIFNSPLVYTVPQLAEALQIGKNAAYELARSKNFPVLTVGKKKLIPREGLERWLQSQTEYIYC